MRNPDREGRRRPWGARLTMIGIGSVVAAYVAFIALTVLSK